MQDRSNRHSIPAVPSNARKRLGGYLVEAGLLTLDQINVILNDQQATGMRFGEIVVARGWLKEQTIEWIVEKVVEPERQSVQHNVQHKQSQPIASFQAQGSRTDAPPVDRPSATAPVATTAPSLSAPTMPTKPFLRRDLPISKPLPSVNASDNGVYWVG